MIQEGENGLFDCPFVGSPRPILAYYRNNELINTSNSKYQTFVNGTLKIFKATKRDRGWYDCRIFVFPDTDRQVILRSNTSRININGKYDNIIISNAIFCIIYCIAESCYSPADKTIEHLSI